jgi:ribosome biogenesis GTPase
MTDFDALARIGWRASFAAQLGELASGQRVARIVEQHRSGYHAHDGHDAFAVQAPAAMIRAGVDTALRPAVGDWVVLDPGKPPMITRLLERGTALKRAAAGERFSHQFIATNVDTVLVVCGLDGDYNLRRLERYLVMIRGSGALPVVVLTKADVCAEAEARVDEVQRLLGAEGVALAVNAREASAAEALAPYLKPGDSAVLVGSSGAGKSTLTNRLLGIERQRTGEVRDHDSRGRHTTTHRSLIALPGGACLIDTPGMRELKLSGEEALDSGQFADIEALAGECRFRDCAHRNEPGCRVRAAVESGELDGERLAHYFKLAGEIASARGNIQAQQKRKADNKVADKALGKRLTEKYGSRGT